MERRDDKMIFTEDEQQSFSVQAETSLVDAVRTAIGFGFAAEKVQERAFDILANSDLASRPGEAQMRGEALKARSLALQLFSAEILVLCADVAAD